MSASRDEGKLEIIHLNPFDLPLKVQIRRAESQHLPLNLKDGPRGGWSSCRRFVFYIFVRVVSTHQRSFRNITIKMKDLNRKT